MSIETFGPIIDFLSSEAGGITAFCIVLALPVGGLLFGFVSAYKMMADTFDGGYPL